MKNVLFIVYYFPPMGGSGVQRPLKFIKYLRKFGWNPIVLCPEPGVYHTFDESLQKELDMMDIELHRVSASTIFQKAAGAKSAKKVQVSDSKARFLRRLLRLFYFPDNKRGWIKPAVEKGIEIIDSQHIELIFSTAPPFSNHIIAQKLKEYSDIPTIVDYRDSWLNNHFFTGMMNWQKSIMRKMERQVLSVADGIISLDEFMAEGTIKNHPEISIQSEIISHGYDQCDFDEAPEATLHIEYGKLNFLYSGLFYEENQPDTFLRAIAGLIEKNEMLREKLALHFQGGLDDRIRQLIQSLGLQSLCFDYGYVTHSQAVANLKQADVLWMVSNFEPEFPQIKSGKLFEYIGSRKPILGLVHPGAAENVLKQYKAGYTAVPTNIKAVEVEISTIIELWNNGNLPKADTLNAEQYDRENLTRRLVQIFNVIIS